MLKKNYQNVRKQIKGLHCVKVKIHPKCGKKLLPSVRMWLHAVVDVGKTCGAAKDYWMHDGDDVYELLLMKT
jgi:hypothetical protein